MANPSMAMKRLRELVKGDDLEGWEHAWQENATPWDFGGNIQPPLREVVESGEVEFARGGRALVPGCGRGPDAIYLAAALNLNTLGLDVSTTAIEHANALLSSKATAIPPGVEVSFKSDDFFTLKVSEEQRFDVIYDYTFFVAISVSRRMEWGQQMAALVKPGGHLITLIFPLDPPYEGGPPWFVRPEHYLEPLGDNFVKVFDKIPKESSPTHVDRERIVVWKRV